MKILIRTLDIFSKKNERNIYQRRNGVLATRLYLITVIASLGVLGLFNALTSRVTPITVLSPSQSEFDSLYSLYSDSLRCPCKNISFPYKSFVSLEPQMHSVCANQFLNDIIGVADSRLLSSLLRCLHDLCQLANRTLNHSITQFLLTRYISGQLVSPNFLLTQTKLVVDEYITSTSNIFVQTFDAAISYIHSNQLLSALLTSYDISLPESGRSGIVTRPRTYQNGSCNCQSNASCTEESSVLPNFHIGCYIIDAVRQSSLQCFFDTACMTAVFNSTVTLPIDRINSTSANIDELLGKLFVNTWGEIKPSYTDYFIACQPTSCVYSLVERHHLLLVITIIISVFGGLSNLLRIAVPILVKSLRKFLLRRRQQLVQPINQ